MQKITLLGAGIMMLAVGVFHLFAPQFMMKEAGIELTTINHFHVIRAAYGGAYLGIAILFLIGVMNSQMQKSSLVAVAILFLGFAAGRVVSIIVDGIPVPLYLGVLAAEVVFSVLAIIGLRKLDQ